MTYTETPEDEVLWGAQAIASAINASLRKTFHLLEAGQIPATKVGSQWTSTRGRLRRFFAGEAPLPIPKPTPKSSQTKKRRVAS